LNSLNLPLTKVISLPTAPAIDAGVANQVASANLNGKSLGASGAVDNDGGVNIGNDSSGAPSFATVNLSSGLLGSTSIPGLPAVPGLPSIPGLPTGGTGGIATLGGVQATLGAVYSQVGTQAGGKVVTPSSGIAHVQLAIGSPALGALLTQLKTLLNPSVLADALSAIPGLGALTAALPSGSTTCALTAPTVANISLAGGGVVVDVNTATITVDLGKLVKTLLGKDILKLTTSNFDLISFLITNLPKILSTGLTNLVTSITTPLENQFKACTDLLGPATVLTSTVLGLIDTGKTTLTGALDGLSTQFSAASTGPLGQLANALKKVVDIGLNVQSGPGIQPHDTTYPFATNLKATPSQNTPVVKNQTLVRAIEIQVLGGAGLGAAGKAPGLPEGAPALPPGIPGLGQLPGVPGLPAPSNGVLNVALGNAAAGPSSSTAAPTTAPPTTTPPTTTAPSTNIPTGVPAGAAGSGGHGPALPLIVLLLGLTLAGGGFVSYRLRGNHTR
ncbi:MAG: choice-of-anchor G family protein, partial [Jatrophihabitans sp.]